MSEPTRSDPIQSGVPTEPTDPRPYVTALIDLAALGWRVSEIRPDREEPVLWHVTVRRIDGFASISVTEADPDAALEELVRYASVDAEEMPELPFDDIDPLIDPPTPEPRSERS